MIRVVIADDHHLARQGIRALLERAADIRVIGAASDGYEAVEIIGKLIPDVAVLDVVMPKLNGTEVVHRVRQLGLKTQTVMLSMYSDEAFVRQSLRHGAKGYLLKRSVTEELLRAGRAANRDEAYLSPEISRYLVSDLVASVGISPEASPMDALTSREREVLQLVAEGNTNNAIAKQLDLSEKTVEKHRTNLMSKIGARDVTGLVRFAIKHRLISLEG